MADSELLDAREAMALLGINETELQALVARGDLRAFRSSGTMKFRRDDVSNVKTEKGTEPTIIVPTAGAKRPAAPGAKPAPVPKTGPGGKPVAGALPALAPSSRPAPPASAGGKKKDDGSSGDVLIDDFELVPTDDVANTQQVTVQQPAVAASGLNEKTIVDTATSETLIDSHLDKESPVLAHAAQAKPASSRASAAPSGSGVASALPAAPAMSRVRAAATSGVHSSASKRMVAAEARSAGPLVTAVLILTAVVFVYTLSIVGVMMARGAYDQGQRVIPPFLSQNSPLPVYTMFYKSTPGTTKDPRPSTEFPAAK